MEQNIQPLNRVALDLGGIQIYWYGIIIGLGVLLGLWLAIREAERRGLHKELFVDLILFAVPIAIICARIYYVIFQWELLFSTPRRNHKNLERWHRYSRSVNRIRVNNDCICQGQEVYPFGS